MTYENYSASGVILKDKIQIWKENLEDHIWKLSKRIKELEQYIDELEKRIVTLETELRIKTDLF